MTPRPADGPTTLLHAHQMLATMQGLLGRHGESIAEYREVLRLDPDNADVHKDLGLELLLTGQFEEGWREYEWRENWPTNRPMWDGSSLDSKTILLATEQGVGDAVQFIRYAAVLKQTYDCRVALQCRSRMIPLLQSCPGIDEFISAETQYDCYAPLMSLPRLLGHNRPEDFPAPIPYLAACPERVAMWKDRLADSPGPKIGIAWKGAKTYSLDCFRSAPLAAFEPIAHHATLFSLQQGEGSEQVAAIGGRFPVVTFGDTLDCDGAFLDTAAIVADLDLVVSVDTALAHVAGAMGIPVWLALAKVPDWRWMLGRDDSPWYPTTRLYRQAVHGEWGEVFERMAGEISCAIPA